MKKYIAPKITIVEMETQAMIAASTVVNGGDYTGGSVSAEANRHRGTWGDIWYDGEEE